MSDAGRCWPWRSTRPAGRPRRCAPIHRRQARARGPAGPRPRAGPRRARRGDPAAGRSLLAGARSATTSLCPYQGLLPYDVDDSESFFGRDDDVRACLDSCGARRGVGRGSVGQREVVAGAGRGRCSAAARGPRVVVITPGDAPDDVARGRRRPRGPGRCCWSTSARRSSRCVRRGAERGLLRRPRPLGRREPARGRACGPTGWPRSRPTRGSRDWSSAACTCSER